MKRTALLMLLVVIGSLVMTVASLRGQRQVPIAAIQKVRGNLYFIGGSDPLQKETFAGGSTAVFVTASGVVVVDTKNPGYGRGILEQIKTVTDKPVTMIINTHTHRDHTGSNTEFASTVEFVAHENTKANLSKATCTTVTNCQAFQGANSKYLPTKTFKDRQSLLSGKDRIDLYLLRRWSHKW